MEIICNREDYEYDLHSLIKAFYPESEISFKRSGEDDSEEKATVKVTIMETGAIVILGDSEPKECIFATDGDTPKNQFKLFLYRVLQAETGKELPWGNLTGIRPTKIAMQLLEQGKRDDEIEEFLKHKHCVSEEKIKLSTTIAKHEKKLLEKLDCVKGYSLYIGIPFCPTTCLYCSFTSNPVFKWKNRMQEYLDAMKKELDFWSVAYQDRPLNTVYIGGGTPTSLSAEQLEELISYVKEKFDLSYLQEFTVEAGRPDSITREKLEVLYKLGVTRISVNPQTMNQETLDLIGRCHSTEQTKEAFALAREVGFDNINMDIILGLPGENAEMVAKTLEEIKKMNPDSLTVHSLAIKRASKLGEWIEKNGREALNDTSDMMEIAGTCAKAMDMEAYYLYRQKNMAGNLENVGFARNGKDGIYNVLIMEEKQTIAAVGAGSITKLVLPNNRIERSDNVKDVEQYLSRIDEMVERRKKLLEFEKAEL
ncbi:MAG: coproporphyrinogen dehydrogenase HemZ [Lachnospiraceae bacterium]|nr:coproporphyrinogen dehydrogenase HemZ [Lachnospiraceae bacterium]